MHDAEALQRLYLIMAAATLVMTCQGAALVAAGRRRGVDPHGFRGFSYARIGWHWIRRALSRGEPLIRTLVFLTARHPEPARASRRTPDRSRWMDDLPCRYLFCFATPAMT